MNDDQVKNLTFRLPAEVYDALKAEAKERGISISRLVRLALAALFENAGEKSQGAREVANV